MRGVCVVVSVTGIKIMARDFLCRHSSMSEFGLRFVGHTQINNEVAELFLAASFALRRTGRTDFDALSQNPIVRLPCKFSARIGDDYHLQQC